jgi:hypothetical protein
VVASSSFGPIIRVLRSYIATSRVAARLESTSTFDRYPSKSVPRKGVAAELSAATTLNDH